MAFMITSMFYISFHCSTPLFQVPVAIDLAAKEAKKPQRLHMCTYKGCTYATYREWQFKAHINTSHANEQFAFDVSSLHDGHIIRR